MSSHFVFVLKQYVNTGGLKVSYLYIAYRVLILKVAGVESDPRTSVRQHLFALVVYHNLASLLPALFIFFLEGRADLSITLNHNTHRLWLGMRSLLFLSLSGGDQSFARYYLHHQSPSHILHLKSLYLSCYS